MADSKAATKDAAVQEEAAPTGLEFSAAVLAWLRDTQVQIQDIQGQMPQPTLAVDAHALQHLSLVSQVVAQAVEDLGLQAPAE
jgi:hypothetical protein